VKRELFELNNNHSYELKQGKRDKNTFWRKINRQEIVSLVK
jgi:hypothetical protein